MTQKKQHHPKRNPRHTHPKPAPPHKTTDKVKDDNEDTSPAHDHCQQPKYQHPEIVVNCQEKKRWQLTLTDVIYGVSAVISLGVLIATYLIYTNAQQNLEEVRNEFDITNRPFLQLGDFKVNGLDTIKGQIVCNIHYRILNFGKLPGTIEVHQFDDLIQSDKSPEDTAYIDTMRRKNIIRPNVTLSNEIEGGVPQDGKADIIKQAADSLMSGRYKYYLFGEIYYYSPLTDKRYKLTYIYKINVVTGGPDILRNKVEQITLDMEPK